MSVKIKTFDVDMLLKNNGMELEIRTKDGTVHLGDCFVTKTGLTWCKGRTTKNRGTRLSWAELGMILKSAESKRAAIRAAKT